jgi:tetratricopeptide (TPR) repeat protein
VSSGELTSAIRRALEERTPEAAWAHLAPFRDRITEDLEVATAWATLLQASPSRPGAVEDARAILARFGRSDPALAIEAVIALIRVDERRPADEPGLGETPAAIAARECEAILAGLEGDAARDPDRGGALRVAYGNALRRLGAGRDAEAVAAIERAITEHGARGEWLVDLGLCHLWAGRFRAALVAFEKARTLLGDRRRVLFHLAIAATGSGEGAKAAAALRALGHVVEQEGDALPLVPELAPVQVRIPTRAAGHGLDPVREPSAASFELVWAQPLSPCHGVLSSPTFRHAIADWGDVVLWDVAPAMVITEGDRKVPVLPLLAVLREGDEKRMRFLAMEQRQGQVRALAEAMPPGVVLYEHMIRVEQICARCASGDVLVKHDHEPPTEHRAVIGKLLVPGGRPLREVKDALDAALARERGVLFAIPSLYEALEMTAVAGKHHKTWGMIERGALSRSAGGLAGARSADG